MCYYTQKRWGCGYWKWLNFHHQCEREYRIGETCGLRLVEAVYDQGPKCKICLEIETKTRKIEKMDQDLLRWYNEGNRPYTIECTLEERRCAASKILELQERHAADMIKLSVNVCVSVFLRGPSLSCASIVHKRPMLTATRHPQNNGNGENTTPATRQQIRHVTTA